MFQLFCIENGKHNFYTFSIFRCVRVKSGKESVDFVISVRLPAFIMAALTGWIFVKIHIEYFRKENLSRSSKIFLESNNKIGNFT